MGALNLTCLILVILLLVHHQVIGMEQVPPGSIHANRMTFLSATDPKVAGDLVKLHIDGTFYADPNKGHSVGVDVLDNCYIIIHTGWYHVHSSIRYSLASALPMQKTPGHRIVRMRSNDSNRRKIIASSTLSSHGETTDYIHKEVYLESGDSLHVEVSNSVLVVPDKASTFFGLLTGFVPLAKRIEL